MPGNFSRGYISARRAVIRARRRLLPRASPIRHWCSHLLPHREGPLRPIYDRLEEPASRLRMVSVGVCAGQGIVDLVLDERLEGDLYIQAKRFGRSSLARRAALRQ